MAKDISRNALREIVSVYRDGGLNRPFVPSGAKRSFIYARNDTGSVMTTGAPASIAGFAASYSYEVAKKLALNDALIYRFVNVGTTASEARASETLASLAEPVKRGAIGRLIRQPLIVAGCYLSNSSYTCVNANFRGTTDDKLKAFFIVAKSLESGNSGRYICALAPTSAKPTDDLYYENITFFQGFSVRNGVLQTTSRSMKFCVEPGSDSD